MLMVVKNENNAFQLVAFIRVIMKNSEIKKVVKHIKDSSTHLHGFWPMGNHKYVFMWLQAHHWHRLAERSNKRLKWTPFMVHYVFTKKGTTLKAAYIKTGLVLSSDWQSAATCVCTDRHRQNSSCEISCALCWAQHLTGVALSGLMSRYIRLCDGADRRSVGRT